MKPQSSPKPISFDQLAELREKTERLSDVLTRRLKGHLSTLYPILAPRRVFGKYLGAKDDVARAGESYTQLAEKYREASGVPFDLRSDLEPDALSAMEHGIEVYPWEYTHDAGGKAITLTSPVRWVVTYRSDYSLSQMRALAEGKGERRPLSLRHFLVNALGIQIVVARTPGIIQLLEDLRYQVRVETGPGLGKLPLLTISSSVPSFRPPDDLILAATSFSGVPAFIELVEIGLVRELQDPLRTQLEGVLA